MMLEQILRDQGVSDLGNRYAATSQSLEGRMFLDLIRVCQDAYRRVVVESLEWSGEVEEDGLLLEHDTKGGKWLKLRQDGCSELLFAVFDELASDVIWFCCTNLDWMRFVVMLHRPR